MKRFILVLKLLLVAAVLAFIWGQSTMDAAASTAESQRFLALVQPAVTAVQKLLTRFGFYLDESVLVRKMAHFSEYALLGFLIYLLFSSPKGFVRILLSAGSCLAAAIIDEGIQFFADGRAPSLRDVGIDLCGALLGILLAALLALLYGAAARRRKKNA